MALAPYLIYVRWQPVEGATGYELRIDGNVVATAGPKARTTRFAVKPGVDILEVLDLPNRAVSQRLNVNYQEPADA